MPPLLLLPGELSDLGVSDGVQLQLGDVVGRVGAALPPEVWWRAPSGAQYRGVRPVAVLHQPTAGKWFRNTGGGTGTGTGGEGGEGAQICTQSVLS